MNQRPAICPVWLDSVSVGMLVCGGRRVTHVDNSPANTKLSPNVQMLI